jgi:stress-induced morphogen
MEREMKVKWSVEGSGCNYARCGIPDFIIEIPDEDFDGMTEKQREKYIEDWVEEEFRQQVYPYWAILE